MAASCCSHACASCTTSDLPDPPLSIKPHTCTAASYCTHAYASSAFIHLSHASSAFSAATHTPAPPAPHLTCQTPPSYSLKPPPAWLPAAARMLAPPAHPATPHVQRALLMQQTSPGAWDVTMRGLHANTSLYYRGQSARLPACCPAVASRLAAPAVRACMCASVCVCVCVCVCVRACMCV
eukprot:1143302-Pelagomonas_calceolata.AAC.6